MATPPSRDTNVHGTDSIMPQGYTTPPADKTSFAIDKNGPATVSSTRMTPRPDSPMQNTALPLDTNTTAAPIYASTSSASHCTQALKNAVIQVLQNASSETLDAFFSPANVNFKVVLECKARDERLIIWRKGLELLIGTYQHHTSLKVFEFTHLVGIVISYDGSWTPKVTAGDAYCEAKWPEVWAGKFESYGGLTKMSVQSEDVDMAGRMELLVREIGGEWIVKGGWTKG